MTPGRPADEDPIRPSRACPPMTPARMSNRGRSAPFFDQHRAQDVVEGGHHQAPDEQEAPRGALVRPVHPGDRGNRTSAARAGRSRISITAERRPAREGNPATARPMPPSTVWTTAVTPTPECDRRRWPPGQDDGVLTNRPARRRPKRHTPSRRRVSPRRRGWRRGSTTRRRWTSRPPTLPTRPSAQATASEAYSVGGGRRGPSGRPAPARPRPP